MEKLEQFFLEAEAHGPSPEQLVEWVFGRAQDAMPEVTYADVVELAVVRLRFAPRAA